MWTLPDLLGWGWCAGLETCLLQLFRGRRKHSVIMMASHHLAGMLPMPAVVHCMRGADPQQHSGHTAMPNCSVQLKAGAGPLLCLRLPACCMLGCCDVLAQQLENMLFHSHQAHKILRTALPRGSQTLKGDPPLCWAVSRGGLA